MKNKLYIHQIVKMSIFNISILSLLLTISCSSGDSDSNDIPTNLSVDIFVVGSNDNNPNGDGSGTVQITASANNAVRYAFRFGTGDQIDSESGNIEHTFLQDGTNNHNITVWAYSGSGAFVNESYSVDVYRSDEAYATLVFSDEFENEGRPDDQKWHYQVIPPNNGSWHNDELQHYTDREENSYVNDGTLKIKGIKEQYSYNGSTKEYTSARLNAKFAFTYGRIEVRAKLPKTAGTWPAIWTLGANSNETGNYFGDQYGNVGWPLCGEIDIMEQTGWDKNSTISHYHWGDLNTEVYSDEGGEIAVENADSEFHLYSMEWDSESIKTYVDDNLVYEFQNGSNKPFNHEHYLLLNIAIGGNLGGDVPANFTEDIFEIDYVRIYQ
ncbi:glycoside hydrolase family 16 protein [Flagellimonas chongwuensis]|nr:glycoside hydrolase family 16 protein [Allomuricauda chongwuensis]